MKKRKLSALAIAISVILLFSACGNKIQQTNTDLSIYADEYIQHDISQYTNVLGTFNQAHGDVKTSFYALAVDETMDESAAQAALKTALASGSGPDVIIAECSVQDAEKLAASGIFYDMNSLIKSDDSFSVSEDYQQQVIDKGLLNGNRYIMPLMFSICTFSSTDEILAKSNFVGLASYKSGEFCEYAQEFLDKNADMALFNETGGSYRAVVQSFFSELNVKTLQSDEFKKVMEVCRDNMQRQQDLEIDVQDLSRPYFAMESGKYLFYCSTDNQALNRLGTFQGLGNATYFTLCNDSGTLNGDVVLFAAINAQSENLQNAWDMVKLLLTNYQDIKTYEPNNVHHTSMYGQIALSVLLSGNQGIVDNLQSGKTPFLNYLNEDKSVTKIPLSPISQTVADAYVGLGEQVGEAYFDYTATQVINYFDGYIQGEKDYDTCLEDAVSYVTVHESE